MQRFPRRTSGVQQYSTQHIRYEWGSHFSFHHTPNGWCAVIRMQECCTRSLPSSLTSVLALPSAVFSSMVCACACSVLWCTYSSYLHNFSSIIPLLLLLAAWTLWFVCVFISPETFGSWADREQVCKTVHHWHRFCVTGHVFWRTFGAYNKQHTNPGTCVWRVRNDAWKSVMYQL